MGDACVRKLDVERFSAGELAGRAAVDIEEHLRSCPACGAYLARLKKEREEFLRVHPFAEFLSARAAPICVGPWYRRFPAALSSPALRPVLAPALVVLIAVAVIPFIPGPESDIRYKGNGSLSYIYKRDGVVHTGAPDDLLRPGDRVQIFYSSAADRNLTLISIDSRGAVSFYHPEEGGAVCSVRSGTGQKLAYPCGIELDSTSGAELVVAVFSDKPFDTSRIKKWIEGIKEKGSDMNALETAIKNNPPEKKSSVQTLMLNKG
ncbi:MAG: hypothetical protein JW699_07445 [Chitinispirillaceae bacterium]|nr:hypothetical protein [Chitinispirillaceae bacterium]